METIDVIYLAAGQGKRANLGFPKQFARLGGKPILVHGLEVLQGMKEIGQIIVASPPPGVDNAISPLLASYSEPLYYSKRITIVEGGDTRQESVFKSLKHVMTEYVLITEAVRPFITKELVQQVINTDGVFVTPWIPATSSVITLSGECLNRELVGEVQMPQKYLTEVLRTAHKAGRLKNATDDAALVLYETAFKPIFVKGIEQNIKITTPLDLVIAEAIYNARYENKE